MNAHGAIPGRMCLFFIAVAAAAWLVPLPAEWKIPLGVGTTAIALTIVWRWLMQPAAARREAPDVLAQHLGGCNYYERDGLCFAPSLSVQDGLCWFHIFCQNRYSKICCATIWFIPMEGTSKAGERHEVEPLMTDVQCAGGEVAVVSFPYPIAARWQGRIMVYDVAARTNYPDGQGELLRTVGGIPVGEPNSEMKEAATMAALLALGTLRITKGASWETHLPSEVAETIPAVAAPRSQVLWELSEGG